jgi:hypothetical protein
VSLLSVLLQHHRDICRSRDRLVSEIETTPHSDTSQLGKSLIVPGAPAWKNSALEFPAGYKVWRCCELKRNS